MKFYKSPLFFLAIGFILIGFGTIGALWFWFSAIAFILIDIPIRYFLRNHLDWIIPVQVLFVVLWFVFVIKWVAGLISELAF